MKALIYADVTKRRLLFTNNFELSTRALRARVVYKGCSGFPTKQHIYKNDIGKSLPIFSVAFASKPLRYLSIFLVLVDGRFDLN